MTEALPSHTLRTFRHTSNLSQLVGTSRRDKLSHSFHASAPKHPHRLNPDFSKTVSELESTNFKHHQQCLCQECHCGRHQCKMNVIKPDLTKATTYQRSFYLQKHVPNVIKNDKEYDRLQGPHLDIDSIYRQSFRGKFGDKLDRPHPEDLLHSNGPSPNISSYSSQFPGYKGDNQYVKPTDKHTRGSFPLRSKSTYSKEYVNKKPEVDDYKYFPDQLRTGSNWFGKTTYGSFFGSPNPEYQAKKVKNIEKKEENPNYKHQYETNYRHEFIKKENPLCPAKVHLETRAQGAFESAKHSFSENTDFKALSPEFHAISTSKHFYV